MPVKTSMQVSGLLHSCTMHQSTVLTPSPLYLPACRKPGDSRPLSLSMHAQPACLSRTCPLLWPRLFPALPNMGQLPCRPAEFLPIAEFQISQFHPVQQMNEYICIGFNWLFGWLFSFSQRWADTNVTWAFEEAQAIPPFSNEDKYLGHIGDIFLM